MNLRFSDEQVQLSETMEQMVEQRTNIAGMVDASNSSALWHDLESFGAFSIGPEDDQLGALELTLISRTLGQVLAPVPFIDTAAVRYALRTELGDGSAERIYATAVMDRGWFLGGAATQCTWDGALAGRARTVLHGDVAGEVVVVAGGADGPVLVRVDPRSEHVSSSQSATLDESLHPLDFTFAGLAVSSEKVLAGPLAANRHERLVAIGSVLTAAQSVGAAASVLGLAREYAAGRTQFGRSIGSFQALRHIMADMYVKVESAWSSVLYAAASLDEDFEGSASTASIAKAYASRTSLDVAHAALQVFGGIAFTDEHPAHHYLRRIVALGDHFGTASDHEIRLGRALVHEWADS
ncbi:MAG: acyl-CoA dehydrogenase family protein [Acidimicrobiales bacterium]